MGDSQTTQSSHNVVDYNKIEIGLDACLIPTRFPNLFIIETVDFFYPLIDDPYLMGKIACANVLSDLYAFGVYHIDHVRIIMAVCDQMTEQERAVVIPLMLKGFQDLAKIANLKAIVQNASVNPWCIIGGVATSLCTSQEYIVPLNAQIGDVLVLTKPLGVQIATNINRWRNNGGEKWDNLLKVITEDEVLEAFAIAVRNMCHLNKNAAYLMHKHEAHAATDVTGFGILGHAENLVKFQNRDVKFFIDTLPIIKNVLRISEVIGNKKRLLSGLAPETSGGLLICMSKDNAERFCTDLAETDDRQAWIIGTVEAGSKTVHISNDVKIIEAS